MFDILKEVKGLTKLDPICIDNNVFRLHYKATFIVLVTSSLLVTSQQYIGDPIDCIVEDSVPQNVMDTYCWIHSTYSITDKVDGQIGLDVAHAGVAPPPSDGTGRQYHKYYQWVCFTLFFQAILFYIPRYLWKSLEAGKLEMLIQDMNVPIIDRDATRDRKEVLVNYLTKSEGRHQMYAFSFFFCELLNFVNVVFQIYLMNVFLGGEFTSYGPELIQMTELDPELRTDPMASLFPKTTKCEFHKYGSSGTVERVDGLCVLPLNIINEKIYVFLWFWFIIVSIITGIQVVFRAVLLCSSSIREGLFKLAQLKTSAEQVENVGQLCSNLDIGDWFLLFQLSKNIEPILFKDIIVEFKEKRVPRYSTN